MVVGDKEDLTRADAGSGMIGVEVLAPITAQQESRGDRAVRRRLWFRHEGLVEIPPGLKNDTEDTRKGNFQEEMQEIEFIIREGEGCRIIGQNTTNRTLPQ